MILTLVLFVFVGCKADTDENNTVKIEVEELTVENISTEELAQKLGDSNVIVVDTRSQAAYIGWQLEGEVRGGHIRGAVDFPMSWTSGVNEVDLREMMEAKGITQDKTVVVYGNNGEQSQEMAQLLRSLGYENVLNYEVGLIEWAKDENLPMDKLANYDKLVHPEWINALVQGESSEIEKDKFKIFEVAWGEPTDYKKGHIPSAYYLDTNAIEEEPIWNRVSDQAIEDMLLEHGITYDTTVVVYGRDTTAAARAASIFMYAGVEDVRLLNGGYDAWIASGYEEETGINTPESVTSFGAIVPSNPNYIVDLPEAKAILENEKAELVSIRSRAEHIGETSGYSYIEPKGRIKGDVWGHGGVDAYSMDDFRNIDNTMRNYKEIAAFWEEEGITPDKEASFYCGTGWRASEAFFYAYLMGWENISVYDGGWYEWSSDKSNPIVIGE